MKKTYFAIVAVVVIVFAYHLITALPTFAKKLFTVTSETLNSQSFSTSGSFAFKSTAENTELLTEMLRINYGFIKNSPIEFNEPEKEIRNFHKLEKFFPNFKYYYISKTATADTVFNEMSVLISETSGLSDSELRTYFDNNGEYLKEKWGITDFITFSETVYVIKQIDAKNEFSCELEDSYFYNANLNILSFRIIITGKNNSIIYLNAETNMYNESENLYVPTTKIFGTTSGGISYV